MEKYIEKPIEPKIIEAEQWFAGKDVEGVITNDPFIPSGNWSDRFADHADIYIVIDHDKKGVNSGDYIIYINGIARQVMSEEQFKNKYNKL